MALLFLAPYMAYAGIIYQWRDAAGVINFTDDSMRVPAGQRLKAARMLAPLALQHSSLGENGKDAWDEKCALCHSPGDLDNEGKLGLCRIVWPPDAPGPLGLDALTETLRFAADGRYSDMDKIEVDDKSLEAIARYLISAQK